MRYGGPATIYLALRGAGEGALIGAIAGGSGAKDGAWIGAAVGAGLGTIYGLAVGMTKSLEAQRRQRANYELCLSTRLGQPEVANEAPAEPAPP